MFQTPNHSFYSKISYFAPIFQSHLISLQFYTRKIQDLMSLSDEESLALQQDQSKFYRWSSCISKIPCSIPVNSWESWAFFSYRERRNLPFWTSYRTKIKFWKIQLVNYSTKIVLKVVKEVIPLRFLQKCLRPISVKIGVLFLKIIYWKILKRRKKKSVFIWKKLFWTFWGKFPSILKGEDLKRSETLEKDWKMLEFSKGFFYKKNFCTAVSMRFTGRSWKNSKATFLSYYELSKWTLWAFFDSLMIVPSIFKGLSWNPPPPPLYSQARAFILFTKWKLTPFDMSSTLNLWKYHLG